MLPNNFTTTYISTLGLIDYILDSLHVPTSDYAKIRSDLLSTISARLNLALLDNPKIVSDIKRIAPSLEHINDPKQILAVLEQHLDLPNLALIDLTQLFHALAKNTLIDFINQLTQTGKEELKAVVNQVFPETVD